MPPDYCWRQQSGLGYYLTIGGNIIHYNGPYGVSSLFRETVDDGVFFVDVPKLDWPIVEGTLVEVDQHNFEFIYNGDILRYNDNDLSIDPPISKIYDG